MYFVIRTLSIAFRKTLVQDQKLVIKIFFGQYWKMDEDHHNAGIRIVSERMSSAEKQAVGILAG